MSNFFNRWSLNLLGLSVLFSYILPYLFTLLIVFIISINSDCSNGGCGPIATIIFIFSIIGYHFFIFLTVFFLIFKENNPEFRIKKPFLLKICNNIFYKIFITILAIIELIIMLGCILLILSLQ